MECSRASPREPALLFEFLEQQDGQCVDASLRSHQVALCPDLLVGLATCGFGLAVEPLRAAAESLDFDERLFDFALEDVVDVAPGQEGVFDLRDVPGVSSSYISSTSGVSTSILLIRFSLSLFKR